LLWFVVVDGLGKFCRQPGGWLWYHTPLPPVKPFLHLPLTLCTFPHISHLPKALDAARGLLYLHKRGIIHRDMKSANLVGGWLGGVAELTHLSSGLLCGALG